MTTQSFSSRKNAALMVALVLVSASTLWFEVLLTKLFSNKLDHHFTFAIISIALLGFGASGVWVQLRQREFPSDQEADCRRLSRYASGYSLALMASVVVFVGLPLDPALADWQGTAALPVYFLIFSAVFFLGGVCVSALLMARGLRPSKVYFWDLLGAGFGAALGPLLLPTLGGYASVVAAALLAWVAAIVLRLQVRAGAARAIGMTSVALGVLALLTLWVPRKLHAAYGLDMVSFKAVEVKDEFRLFGPSVQTYWNAIARLDVSPTGTSNGTSFRYGISRQLWDSPLQGRMVLVDGGANTRQYILQDMQEADRFLRTALWAAPYVLRSGAERSLVIGPGGGIDILVGKLFGVRQIDALELNPDMYRLLIGRPEDPERDQYTRWLKSDDQTRVTVHNVEARHFAHTSRSADQYDVVLASGVDTLSAVQTSGNALSENFLYTRDAVTDYLRLLRPGGMLALTHWHLEPPSLALKMFATYLQVLQDQGVQEPGKRVYVISEGFWESAIVKKGSDLTVEEVERIRAFADAGGFHVTYDPLEPLNAPTVRGSDLMFRVLGRADRAMRKKVLATLPLDVTPATDDKPYFYWAPVRDAGAGSLGDAVFLHPSIRWMFVLAVVLALGLGALPAVVLKRRGADVRKALGTLPVFAASGLAFILAENALFLQLTLFVGGPLHSLSVVLPSVLVGYSMGSLLAPRFSLNLAGAAKLALPIGAGFALMGVALVRGLPALMGASSTIRLAVAVALVLPFGVVLGLVVPWTMEGMKARGADGAVLPWMWAVSSACNTIGSMLFVPLCREVGVRVTFALSAVLYLVALGWAAVQMLPTRQRQG